MSTNEAKLGGGTPVPVRRYAFGIDFLGRGVVYVQGADYDALAADLASLRDQLQASQCAEALLSDEVRGLKEQRNSLRADAERYRWLRDNQTRAATRRLQPDSYLAMNIAVDMHGEDWDDAIDSAIAASPLYTPAADLKEQK
jgi:hypothetical protein